MALSVSSSLVLPITLDGFSVGPPILAGIIGMAGAPFLLAIPADLVVHGIGFNLAAVIFPTALPLAIRPAADKLMWIIKGGLKESLAVMTTAKIHQATPDMNEVPSILWQFRAPRRKRRASSFRDRFNKTRNLVYWGIRKWYYQAPMRPTVIVPVLASMLAAPMGYAKSKPGIPATLTACAAFAQDGTSAAATTNATTLSLEVTDPSGRISHMHLGLRFSPSNEELENESMRMRLYSCHVFFNHDNNLLAVSVALDGFPTFQHHLQIAVADLRSSKWVGDFTVGPQHQFVPLALAGFFQKTNSLVVTGAPPGNNVTGIQSGSFASLLFDTTGGKLDATPSTRTNLGPSDGTPGRFYADAIYAQLWAFPCEMFSTSYSKQPTCSVLSTALLGSQSAVSQFDPQGYAKKRTDLWMLPGTFASPGPNTILIAENVLGVNTIWRVNIQKKTLERFVLPERRHYPQSEEIYGRASISPDGQVLAIPLLQYTLAFPYLLDNYVYKGTDIAVVDLRPFQLLGILRHRHAVYTPAFAVDHRQGRATILVYRQDHWEHREFACPPGS